MERVYVCALGDVYSANNTQPRPKLEQTALVIHITPCQARNWLGWYGVGPQRRWYAPNLMISFILSRRFRRQMMLMLLVVCAVPASIPQMSLFMCSWHLFAWSVCMI